MNKKLMTLAMASAFMAGLSLAATVTSVQARQRWPWNGKVDIVYTLDGGTNPLPVFDLKFKALDGETPVTMTTVTGDGASGVVFGAGQKVLTWDSTTDHPGTNSENMTYGIYAMDISGSYNYLKVDLASGKVTRELDKPETWSTADKSDYLWLKRVLPGTFKMGADTVYSNPQHDVTLTKSYFVGVFELTRDQYNKIGGPKGTYSNPSGDGAYPANNISYEDLRGAASDGYDWPNNGHAVASTSGLGLLRKKVSDAMKSDYIFDLPTEAQWECACRAGHEGNYWNDGTAENIVDYKDSHLDELAWYYNNASSNTHEVGGKDPSSWGFYDMHGNVWEWCLDWYVSLEGATAATDPAGPTSGTFRLQHGGSYTDGAAFCRSAFRGSNFIPSYRFNDFGARVVLEFN